LREALSNVARHAAATHVDVTLRVDTDLSLQVVDDGTGSTVAQRAVGDGLRNMMRRAQDLGGRADITPGVDRGTSVLWVVPVEIATPSPRAPARRRARDR
jgi:signal transduction histidine kinase